MRHLFYIVVFISLFSCQQKTNEAEVDNSVAPPPEIPLTPFQDSVKTAITEIQKYDLETMGGNTIRSMQISGMEIMKLSKKDYYIEEKNAQERDFGNYLTYMERFKNSPKAPIYNPAALADSKLKHAAILRYLDEMIKNASLNKEVYKVAYYLKADTKMAQYNQLQTVYLDQDLKKIEANYSHVKLAY